METNKIISYVEEISNNITELLSCNSEETIKRISKKIKEKIEKYKEIEDLSVIIENTIKLLSIFELNSDNEEIKNQSYLYLMSIISSEKKRIMEKYKLNII